MANLPSISPSQQALILQLLQDPTASLESIADSLNWPLEHLTLYLTSAVGLALIAECELAIAVRTRVAAAAQLHAAINALGLMLSEYASTADKIPFDDRKITTHELREVQRSNARRAAHLLFRLAHFTPRPIKSYTPAVPNPASSNREMTSSSRPTSAPPEESTTRVSARDNLHAPALASYPLQAAQQTVDHTPPTLKLCIATSHAATRHSELETIRGDGETHQQHVAENFSANPKQFGDPGTHATRSPQREAPHVSTSTLELAPLDPLSRVPFSTVPP